MQEATNLNRLVYFVAVVDAGSFTRAADQLGITKAVVSKQVAKLEQDVGTTLLMRTTRRLQPTEAGRMFHARCVSILKDTEDAFGELEQVRAEPKGLLRLTAPYDYGTSVVLPVVTEFAALFPGCTVDLHLGDRTVDLVAEKMDLAVRLGWLTDSGQEARRIGAFRHIMVAAPLLAHHLIDVREMADVAALPFVANTALKDPLEWTFTRGGHPPQTVRFKATIAINTTPAVLDAVKRGSGLSILPDFLAAPDILAGRLVPVLEEWHLPEGGVFTVYPAARYRPRKVSAFVELLERSLPPS